MNKKLLTHFLVLALLLLPALACNKANTPPNPDPNASPTPTNTALLTVNRLAALVPVQGKAVLGLAQLLNNEKRPNGQPFLSNAAYQDVRTKLRLVLEDAQTISAKLDQSVDVADVQKIIDCTVDLLRLVNTLNAVEQLPANFQAALQYVVDWSGQLAEAAKLILPLLNKKDLTPGVPINLQSLDDLTDHTTALVTQRDLQTLLIGLGLIVAGTVESTRQIFGESDPVKLQEARRINYQKFWEFFQIE